MRHRWLKWVSGLFLIYCGCTPLPSQTTGQLPVPAGQARLWFYRDWQPSESLNLANLSVNGAYFASVANGSTIYRDVTPGRYHIAPASFVPNSRQDANIDVVAGQQAYLKIVSSTAWGSDNTASKNIARDAFYVWLVPAPVAQAEIARDRGGI
jgi:Protein of unknown function (DUF2846)